MTIEAPAQELPDTPELPKTPGEKFYDWLQFTMGKAAIVAVTAGIAYVGRYGKDSYRGVPNYFKRFQHWAHDGLLHNRAFPLAEKGERGRRLADAVSNTMLLFHGGNIFAFIMKPMENGREQIANWYNRRWGKPGDEDITHERYKGIAKQSWGDVVKGRLGSWAIVFTSFAGLDMLAGRNKKSGMYHFDHYEEWFGRWIAGFSKGGKNIANVPVGKPLPQAQSANKAYRFGRIVALDFYATSAAIIIWNFISRLSAQKRHEKNGFHPASETAATPENTPPEAVKESRFSEKLARPENFSAAVADKSASLSPSI